MFIPDLTVALLQCWISFVNIHDYRDHYLMSPFVWMFLIGIFKIYIIIQNKIMDELPYLLLFLDTLLVCYSFTYNYLEMMAIGYKLFGVSIYASMLYEIVFIIRTLKI